MQRLLRIIWILSLLASLLKLTSADSSHIVLSETKSTVYKIPSYESYAYFKYTVNKIHNKEDLIFAISPIEWYADPNAFASSTNKFPNHWNNSEYVCYSLGLEMCTIPSREIEVGKTFYIGVYCDLPCTFRIETIYEIERELNLSKPLTIVFTEKNRAQGELIKLTIPEGTKEEYFIISAMPKDYQKLNHRISLYMSLGDSLPTTSSFLESGKPAWHDGVVIAISRQARYFCVGCTYTFLLVSEDDTVIELNAKAIGTENQIVVGQEIYDYIVGNKIQVYTLEIDKQLLNNYEESELKFQLTPYSGNPDIFVNPKERPSFLENYQWNSKGIGREILSISPVDRIVFSGTKELYYIAITSHGGSTYSLLTYIDNKDNKTIKFGVTESGYVGFNQVINFHLIVPNTDSSINATISISLMALSGNPDLYIKSCDYNYDEKIPFPKPCSFSAHEIINKDQIHYSPQMYYSSATHPSGNEQISFKNDPSICNRDKCYFAIAVFGNQEAVSSHFSLVVSHSSTHTIIQEKLPIRHSIEEGEYHYYKFTLVDPTNVLSVNFQLTPISGTAQLYSSKLDIYPTSEKFQKIACGCSHTITYCGFNPNDTPLNGTYYIAVYGYTHATYTISAFTSRRGEYLLMRIYDGVPHKFVFPDAGGPPLKEAYFLFEVDINEPHLQIEITITPLNGKHFKIYLAENFIPDAGTAQWVSTNNRIIVSTNDTIFSPHAAYVLALIPYDPENPNSQDLDTRNWQCMIQYTTSIKKMKQLTENVPLKSTVSKSKPAYFRFFIDKDDKDIIVKITDFTQELSMYISVDPERYFPGEENGFDYQGDKLIKLTRTKMETFCNTDKLGAQRTGYCTAYVGIYSERQEEIDFTITIIKADERVILQEGIPDSHLVPNKGKYVEYELFPSKTSEDIYLSISSLVDLKFFVKAISTQQFPERKDWIIEENDQDYFIEKERKGGEEYVLIEKKIFEGVEKPVIIVRVKNEKVMPDQNDMFTITYLGSSTQLLDSHVRYDEIVGGTYNFYKIDCGRNDILKIILTPLDHGVPVLYLNNQSNPHFPTKDKFMFRSTHPTSPSIIIKNPSSNYFLSVYSATDSLYAITYTNLLVSFFSLTPNVPLSITIPKEESGVYALYRQQTRKGFRILLSNEEGNLDMYINKVIPSKAVKAPTKESFDYQDNGNGYIYFSHEEIRYDSVLFIIYVMHGGLKESRATIVVAEQERHAQLVSGKYFNDYVREGIVNKYSYLPSDISPQEEIEINVVVYSGDPILIASTNPDLENSQMWVASRLAGEKSGSLTLKIKREDATHPTGYGPTLQKGEILYYGILTKGGDASYSIRIQTGKTIIVLEDGSVTGGTFTKHEEKTYLFDCAFTTKKLITFTFAITTENSVGKYYFPHISIKYLPGLSDRNLTDEEIANRTVDTKLDIRESLRSKIIRFVAKQGMYFIRIQSELDLEISYLVSLNANGLSLLPPNSEILSYLAVNTSEIYEVVNVLKGHLLVQVFECFGKVKISAAEDDDHYEAKDFSVEFKKSTDGKFDHYFLNY